MYQTLLKYFFWANRTLNPIPASDHGVVYKLRLARPRNPVGGKRIQVAVNHGPGIQPCWCSDNPAYQRDLMRRQERKQGAMLIPPQVGLTMKVLGLGKTVMGKADGVYGLAGN